VFATRPAYTAWMCDYEHGLARSLCQLGRIQTLLISTAPGQEMHEGLLYLKGSIMMAVTL